MNTLIELYDERAIENVLAADVFRLRTPLSETTSTGEIEQRFRLD